MTIEDYEDRAHWCIEMAENAERNERAVFLALADVWLTLAEEELGLRPASNVLH